MAAAIGMWAWQKKLFKPEHLVVAIICGLATRMIFNAANYLYHWVPFTILFMLLLPYRKIFCAVFLCGFGPWLLDTLLPPIGTSIIPPGKTINITSPDLVIKSIDEGANIGEGPPDSAIPKQPSSSTR